MAGLFLVLDGMDGAGKSTQLELLAKWLGNQGEKVVQCRDPGGTLIGEAIRSLLLSPESEMVPSTEMLLYMASRAELVASVIRPALDTGQVVLCDRFLLSTVVYQGHAGGLDPAMIWRMGKEATGGLLPDWTGVLDLDPAECRRRQSGPADRIEQRSLDYHARVRTGFVAEAERAPERITLLNANRPVEMVHEEICREVARALKKD